MHYVYLLKSRKNGNLYIGYSSDLKRRLSEHNNGQNRSTKPYAPYSLVYYEAYRSSADAKERESQLKRFSQAYTQLKRRVDNSISEEFPE